MTPVSLPRLASGQSVALEPLARRRSCPAPQSGFSGHRPCLAPNGLLLRLNAAVLHPIFRMKRLLSFLFSVAVAISSLAQSPPPEIAALVAKYETDVRTVDSARSAAAATLQAKYLADLTNAETTASANGKVGEAAAIVKTRAAVAAGHPEAASRTGLPAPLQKRHADYLASLAASEHEFSPRYSRLSSEYLRSLATVESRLPATSPLRSQIAEIKAKLLNGSTQSGELVGTWQFVKSDWKGIRRIEADGTFSDENGKPKGKWSATASEMRLEYGNGNIERFQLPVKKHQLFGTSNEGGPLTATRQN